MKESFYIAELLDKKVRGKISDKEQAYLDNWVKQDPENLAVYRKFLDQDQQLNKLKGYQALRGDDVWLKLDKQLFGTKRINTAFRKWYYFAAAALVPLILATAFLLIRKEGPALDMATLDEFVIPGSQKAVLVLSNGEKVDLTETKTEGVIRDKDIVVSHKQKGLHYESRQTGRFRKPVFHTLQTPRGGKYNLQLADGTVVWVNAGSSLRFPVEFTDSVRRVYLKGEACFKVAHNGKPFLVSTDDMQVRVLGTTFNVSAYQDEQEISTTLVEGSVQIETSEGKAMRLKPDEQASYNKDIASLDVRTVDAGRYTSWIENRIEFSNTDLEQVMKSLARWYDFNYRFENAQASGYHFSARFDNQENISDILEMLEMTTQVKFDIENETIVVR